MTEPAAPPPRRPLGYAARQMSEADDAAAAGAVPFAHFARFVSIDSAGNRYRGYELRWQPALWGGVLLVRTWGRLGARRRVAVSYHPDRASARPLIERAVRRRLRRGYRLVEAI
jgi:predicted DNA-binding WGR domain protein